PEPARRQISQLIAETGEPERLAVFAQALRVVFVNWNTGSFEGAAGMGRPLPVALYRLVFPPVVIAENGMHAERRLQPGEHRRPLAGRNQPRDMAVSGDVVAEQDDDVGLKRIGALDNRVDAIDRHPG